MSPDQGQVSSSTACRSVIIEYYVGILLSRSVLRHAQPNAANDSRSLGFCQGLYTVDYKTTTIWSTKPNDKFFMLRLRFAKERLEPLPYSLEDVHIYKYGTVD